MYYLKITDKKQNLANVAENLQTLDSRTIILRLVNKLLFHNSFRFQIHISIGSTIIIIVSRSYVSADFSSIKIYAAFRRRLHGYVYTATYLLY